MSILYTSIYIYRERERERGREGERERESLSDSKEAPKHEPVDHVARGRHIMHVKWKPGTITNSIPWGVVT